MITVSTREDFVKHLAKLVPWYSVGAEIGVLYGDFSKMMWDTFCPKLYLIDPYETSGHKYGNGLQTAYSTQADYENVLNRFAKEIAYEQVTVINKFSYDAVKDFDNESLDFVYLDGSHLYQDVKRDLADWLPKLKPGGIMAGHDLINLDDFGVIKAVSEFIIEHDYETVLFNDNGGDWALRRKI